MQRVRLLYSHKIMISFAEGWLFSFYYFWKTFLTGDGHRGCHPICPDRDLLGERDVYYDQDGGHQHHTRRAGVGDEGHAFLDNTIMDALAKMECDHRSNKSLRTFMVSSGPVIACPVVRGSS